MLPIPCTIREVAGLATTGQEGAYVLPALALGGAEHTLLQVDVFVNGRLMPFSMKIGEAGEAFFVFETAEEIPENLVTSPILEAIKPGERNARTQETGSFGAGSASPQEPEFLDLDASAGSSPREGSASPPSPSHNSSQDESEGPGILSRTAQLGKAMMDVAREVKRSEADKLKDKTVMNALRETGRQQRECLANRATAAVNAVEHEAGVDFPSQPKPCDEILPKPGEGIDPLDIEYTSSKLGGFFPYLHPSNACLRYGVRYGGLPWTHP